MAVHGAAFRGALILIFVVLSAVGAQGPGAAESDVERRVADFWKRVDALLPADHLSAADLGQWALNVTERDSRARISLSDFRSSTAVMQAAMDRVRASSAPTLASPPAGVEDRIAQFWQRLDVHQPLDRLSATDVGQWAVNVIDRDPTARIAVVDFRGSTASMQSAIDRAGPAPLGAVSQRLRFQFTTSIPMLDRVDLERGTRLGAGYLGISFGQEISEMVTIYAIASAAGEQHRGVSFGRSSCCVAGSKVLFGEYAAYYDISNRHWNNPFITGPARSMEHRKVAVHEYVHVWQDWAGCLLGPGVSRPVPDWSFAVPVWFFEGMAEYLAHEFMADAGERSASEVASQAAFYRSEAKRVLATMPLSGAEAQHPTAAQGSDLNGPAYTAVKMLAETHGRTSLRDFCLRGARGDWRPAFATTFGRSVERFYEEYSVELSRP